MSERTADQRIADDNLDAAVRRVVEVEDGYRGELVTDWMVIYACADPADEQRTIYGAAYPGGYLAAYRVLGLLELSRHHIEQEDDEL